MLIECMIELAGKVDTQFTRGCHRQYTRSLAGVPGDNAVRTLGQDYDAPQVRNAGRDRLVPKAEKLKRGSILTSCRARVLSLSLFANRIRCTLCMTPFADKRLLTDAGSKNMKRNWQVLGDEGLHTISELLRMGGR